MRKEYWTMRDGKAVAEVCSGWMHKYLTLSVESATGWRSVGLGSEGEKRRASGWVSLMVRSVFPCACEVSFAKRQQARTVATASQMHCAMRCFQLTGPCSDLADGPLRPALSLFAVEHTEVMHWSPL